MDKGIFKEARLITTKKMLWLFAFGFLYSIFIVLFTDYLAYERIGAVISIFLTILVLTISLFNFKFGLLSALFILFTFPSYPRDILDIYSALQETKEVDFYSIKYMSVSGFSLAQWLFLGLFLISFIRFLLNGAKISNVYAGRHIKLLFSFVLILLIGTTYSIFWGNGFYLREFISDLRFPILFIFGIFITWAYVKDVGDISKSIDYFVIFMLLLLVVSGIKTILFLIDDKINDVFRLGLANPVYLTFPLILSLMLTWRSIGISKFFYYTMLLLGLLSILPEGRGTFIIYFLVIVLVFIVVWRKERNSLPKIFSYIMATIAGFILMFFTVIMTNERLWNFILYKASFFAGELLTGDFSESPTVRIYEFKNIIKENLDSILGLLWGKGAGGYFQYKNFPLPFHLGIADYTSFELSKQLYFHPHLPFNYWLLKGGILGLVLYAYLFYHMFRVGYVSLSRTATNWTSSARTFYYLLALSSVPGFFQSYWQPDYLFFYSIILTIGMLDFGEHREL